jgi:hypothetical protein
MVAVSLSEQAKALIESRREAVLEAIEELDGLSHHLRALLSEIDQQLESRRRMLRQMQELVGQASQLPIDSLSEELRGQRLGQVAVELLRQRRDPEVVIHYRQWLELFSEAGLRIGGKNPTATFLTQLGRCPEVESVRPRSGLYRLRRA